MLEKIKRLGAETALYGVSTILGRFLTFLLTPVYTHFLLPGDLGTVAIVFAYIAFFNVIYAYGMEGAFMKYVSTLEMGSRKQNFTLPLVAVTLTSTLLTGGIVLNAEGIANLIGVPERHFSVIPMAGWILLLDAIAVIPFASLRMEHKARMFVTIRVASIALNVALNVVLLIPLKMGVEAIFISGVASSAFSLVLLLPHVLKNISFEWVPGLFRALLRFGIPSVPAGLASMMIQVVDRPIMQSLAGDAAVGVYQANHRLGIFMMLVVSMFDFAWRPFFLSHASEPDAKNLFARVLTYFCLLGATILVVLSLFLADLVTAPIFAGYPILAQPYWVGLGVIPPILLGYLFLGIYNNLMAGVYIEKKTSVLPLVTFAGASVNIGANYLLIPRFGLMGGAYALLLAYAVMAATMYLITRRFYPLPVEWGRIGKIAFSAAATLLLWWAVDAGSLHLLWKGFLLLLFIGSMFASKFFIPSELRVLSRIFARQTPPPVSGPGDR
jgi:O-antigen/teichoic acid export membrane protein